MLVQLQQILAEMMAVAAAMFTATAVVASTAVEVALFLVDAVYGFVARGLAASMSAEVNSCSCCCSLSTTDAIVTMR